MFRNVLAGPEIQSHVPIAQLVSALPFRMLVTNEAKCWLRSRASSTGRLLLKGVGPHDDGASTSADALPRSEAAQFSGSFGHLKRSEPPSDQIYRTTTRHA